VSRRRVQSFSLLFLFFFLVIASRAAAGGDLRALISQADLVYDKPVPRSEEGMPIGNGRMGSLVWTSPTAVKLQINRVDLQPINRETNSFFERNTDYMGGCGFVDIDLGGAGPDVFTNDGTTQHLSVYDGLLDMKTRGGLTARLLAWHARDVMAIEIDDQRATPESIQVNLRMLRFEAPYFGGDLERMVANHIVTVRTRNHTAASQLVVDDHASANANGPRIGLLQEFHEGTHAAKSGVMIALAGRPSLARYADDTNVRLVAPAARGRFVILIASAATLDAKEDIAATTARELDAAASKDFAALAADNASWWHAFWDRGSIALHSSDGVADYVALNYHYFLYVMASTSRGKFPPKFNGMLWNTAGDLRTWGAQHWFANLSCYYEALFATNRLDLLDPMFDMYSGMFEASALAAKQQWGSEGIYIPETVWFDGLAALPDDIAAEMRDLFLMRKPWAERSARFNAYASTKTPYTSRWNFIGGGNWVEGKWMPTERGFGPYGPVTHILGSTAKIAYLYWRRYEYTDDEIWLRDRAYPMIKGAAEFYRHFPNLTKGPDGKLHIHFVNSNESVMGANDTDEDLSAMRGIFAVAIRASEILKVDATLAVQWRQALADLPALTTSDTPEALKPDNYTGPRVFVRGVKPIVNGRGFLPDGNSMPMWFFDLVNLENPDRDQLAIANATFDRAFPNGIDDKTPVGVLSKMAIAGTTLGRVEATRVLIPNQIRTLRAERDTAYKQGLPLANRMTLREGPQALDAQRLGRAAEGLQLALLQSAPGTPGGEAVIRVFPAWPKEWDASYTLRARGAFIVSASHKAGKIESVTLKSEAGGVCRVRNPWGAGAAVAVRRNGKRAGLLRGAVFTIATTRGETIVLAPAGRA
jgi:hypothetical protein